MLQRETHFREKDPAGLFPNRRLLRTLSACALFFLVKKQKKKIKKKFKEVARRK